MDFRVFFLLFRHFHQKTLLSTRKPLECMSLTSVMSVCSGNVSEFAVFGIVSFVCGQSEADRDAETRCAVVQET